MRKMEKAKKVILDKLVKMAVSESEKVQIGMFFSRKSRKNWSS